MRNLLILASLLIVAAAGAWFLRHGGSPDAALPLAKNEVPQQPSVAAADVLSEPERIPSQTAGEDEPPLPPGLTQQEARKRRRLLELDRAAEARFEEAVATDGLTADDVQPAVRALFATMTLEPAFDPDQGREGYVNGLRIAALTGRNPLAKAGFRAGDRLTRLNGQPLEDPAQIVYIVTGLRERFEVCAVRNGSDYCRIIEVAGG